MPLNEEFWFISVPGDKTPQQSWDKMNRSTAGHSSNYKFNIPDLKVGTLDSLIGLSDDLAKMDVFAESVCKKVSGYMAEVLEDQRDKLMSNLKAGDQTLTYFMQNFQWNMAKYPTKQSLRSLSDIIAKVLTQVESDLRVKSQSYNNLKTNLQNMERKSTGSLLLRNLGQIVRKEDFVLDSEYLQTLLVAVPIALTGEWEKKYEDLTEYVVPRSSRQIFEDDEYSLFSVTLFKKVAEEFKYKCTRHKFFVRDYQYSEQDSNSDRNQISKLASDKKRMLGPLLRWLKVNFSEVFIAWMHIKALRVFVESVLRYGLPVNFQCAVLVPHKKQHKRLRESLNNLYSSLDSTGLTGITEEDNVPGIAMQDYYPYVFYKVQLDFESKNV